MHATSVSLSIFLETLTLLVTSIEQEAARGWKEGEAGP